MSEVLALFLRFLSPNSKKIALCWERYSFAYGVFLMGPARALMVEPNANIPELPYTTTSSGAIGITFLHQQHWHRMQPTM